MLDTLFLTALNIELNSFGNVKPTVSGILIVDAPQSIAISIAFQFLMVLLGLLWFPWITRGAAIFGLIIGILDGLGKCIMEK